MGSPVGKIAAHLGNGMQLFLLHSCPSSDLVVEVLGYPDAVALLSCTQWEVRFLYRTTLFSWIIHGWLYVAHILTNSNNVSSFCRLDCRCSR